MGNYKSGQHQPIHGPLRWAIPFSQDDGKAHLIGQGAITRRMCLDGIVNSALAKSVGDDHLVRCTTCRRYEAQAPHPLAGRKAPRLPERRRPGLRKAA